MYSSRALYPKRHPRGILLHEASPADAIPDDPANITQHSLLERKPADTKYAYVSQHDLQAWHDVGNAMCKLFASVCMSKGRICMSDIQ